MYKAVRSLVLAVLVTSVAVPMMKADRRGTNPRPQGSETEDSSASSMMVDAILFNLGML